MARTGGVRPVSAANVRLLDRVMSDSTTRGLEPARRVRHPCARSSMSSLCASCYTCSLLYVLPAIRAPCYTCFLLYVLPALPASFLLTWRLRRARHRLAGHVQSRTFGGSSPGFRVEVWILSRGSVF